MGPKGQQGKLQLVSEEDQPAWARRMEQNIVSRLDAQGAKHEALQQRVADLEWHSRKWNLLIFGIEVSSNNCEAKMEKFLKDDLELDQVPMLAACHPLPHPQNAGAIIRFVKLGDRDRVLRALPKLKNKGKRISVVSDMYRDENKTKGAQR